MGTVQETEVMNTCSTCKWWAEPGCYKTGSIRICRKLEQFRESHSGEGVVFGGSLDEDRNIIHTTSGFGCVHYAWKGDPPEKPENLHVRWKPAIDAQKEGRPIQYRSFNTYADCSYWSEKWIDNNQGFVDFDEEIKKSMKWTTLHIDWRPKPDKA